MTKTIESQFEWFTEDPALRGQAVNFYRYIMPEIKEAVKKGLHKIHCEDRVYKDYIFRITTEQNRMFSLKKSYVLESTVLETTMQKNVLKVREVYSP